MRTWNMLSSIAAAACSPLIYVKPLVVLVGALHPDEGLQVDHVARTQVAHVATHGGGELEQARVRFPVRPRAIAQGEAVRVRRGTGDIRLEEDVRVRLRDEAEHGDERPGEHARLPAGQRRHYLHPALEPARQRTTAMKELVQAFGKGPGAFRRPDGIAQGHLLEGEDHAVARALLDAHGARRDLGELACTQQPPQLLATEDFLPALVRFPFVAALPLHIRLVAESTREKAQELPAAAQRSASHGARLAAA